MATAEQDYYELLGVGRDASDADIKRAFRRLARELHPDVSDAPNAEERFKKIVEAYEVLSKAETRQLYDRYGHAGLRSGGFQSTTFDFGSISDLFSAFFGDEIFGGATSGRRARGGDVVAEVEVELVEAATGTRRRVPFDVAVTCDHCGGVGAEPGSRITVCPTCGGSGRLQHVSRSLFGEFVRTRTCTSCGGDGRKIEEPCRECGGSGRTVQERALEVEIPAGIHDGQRIRLTGFGHAGAPGARAGDAYVQVRVLPDARFVREGDDIYSQVDLTITQAALGTTITVPTLDGERELSFDPGTQAGSVVVLRGQGMPSLERFRRGDHRVLVNVIVPRQLSDEQRHLLEEFERVADDGTYAHRDEDEGFFEKLRGAFS
jgi:molecular chaperone DnaJ